MKSTLGRTIAAMNGFEVLRLQADREHKALLGSLDGVKEGLAWASETDFERTVMTNWAEEWPSWKVISTMSHHDSYHAGQIALLRAVLTPTTDPPRDEGDEWEE